MNDFTKEELESISNWGECYTEFGNSWCDKIERPLINKIQAMIDNYSEICEKIWPVNMIKPCPECKRFHDE
jgi:hypothetical protein